MVSTLVGLSDLLLFLTEELLSFLRLSGEADGNGSKRGGCRQTGGEEKKRLFLTIGHIFYQQSLVDG